MLKKFGPDSRLTLYGFRFLLGSLLFLMPFGASVCAEELEQMLVEMNFREEAHDWQADRFCRARLQDGILRIEAVGGAPTLSRSVNEIGGRIRVVLRLRTSTDSDLSISWMTASSPRRSDDKQMTLSLQSDGQWHDYEFLLPIPDYLTSVFFRFSTSEGLWEIDSIKAYRRRSHPLVVERTVPEQTLDPDGVRRDRLRYTIRNDAPVPVEFRVGNRIEPVTLARGRTIDLLPPIKAQGNLSAVNLELHPVDFPSIRFPVFLYRPEGTTDWIVRPLRSGGKDYVLEIAPDARMARIRHENDVVALVAPIVHRNGTIPDFVRKEDSDANRLVFEATDMNLVLQFETGEETVVRFLIRDLQPKTVEAGTAEAGSAENESPMPEGPVVRMFGTLQSGLLGGVEFLGPGDRSSSVIDLEEPYNRRTRPDPLWITMPLAVLGTEQGGVMLTWNDMTLRPALASPNHLDGTDDHRLSLVGRTIEAELRFFASSERTAPNRSVPSYAMKALDRYVASRGLPEAPPAPRTENEQRLLSLSALQGSLRSEDRTAWGYAVEPEWPRRPFADMLSSMIRLTDRTPKVDRIVSGGSDIANDAVYFLTGRIEQWKQDREEAIRSILALQNPDGSFLYRTRFPEVESAITSPGYTAVRALEVMEFARLTGDERLLESVRRSLDYLYRAGTLQAGVPRGGFYRDSPLHTPDLLTAASIAWLGVWGYENSGKAEDLELARNAALAGLPFVYQWSDRENMLYLAVPKFGGTERRLPTWFGWAQPRIGILYAYALARLAAHDSSVDWNRAAWGILHAAERLQLTEGIAAGCLPDTFSLETGEALSWKINPCALVSLRLALEGKVDSLVPLRDRGELYVSPFPLRPTSTGIEATDVPDGLRFQILRNGNRIHAGQGSGPIALE